MNRAFAAALVAGSSLVGTTAGAAIVEYSDITSFNAAIGGASTTLETFDSATPGLFTEGVETNFGSFAASFNNSPGGNQRAGIYTSAQVNAGSGTALNGTNSLSWGEFDLSGRFVSGGDGPLITLRFFQPITAIAFDFSDSDVTDSYNIQIGSESPVTITNGSDKIFQRFVGFTSDTAFSTIVFSQTDTGGWTETFSIDNVRTNGGLSTAPSPVPLPAGMPLLLAGLGAFGIVRRARKTA